jgi:exonuclease SbcC
MIPHILHIKNFLSYGPDTQIIDFKPYNLINLSGKNGHGKSALLDAITWGIWGQARKSSGQAKPDAGLMHLGQKHMMVILEFEVNGTMYRVRREYLQTQSKPFATLDFGIQNNDGKLISLTDKTIKDTQDKIDRTIGITYESFVNSTFLRQGQSNEFSKKSPKERKEILAQILQLQRFEQQKKIALAHARKLQLEVQTNIQIEERINQELQQLQTVESDYQQTTQKIVDLEQNRKDLEQKQASIQNAYQKIKNLENESTFIKKQKKDLEEKLKTIVHQIDTINQDLKKLSTEPSLADLKNKQETIQKQIDQSQKALQEKNILKEKYLGLKEQLAATLAKVQQDFDQKKQKLSFSLHSNEEKLKQITAQIHEQVQIITQYQNQSKAALAQNNEFLKIMSTYSKSSALYEQEKMQLDLKRQEYQTVCAQGTYLKQHAVKLQKDIQHLESQEHYNCLMCDQTLDENTKNNLLAKLLSELKNIDLELNSSRQQAQTIKTSTIEIQTTIKKHQEEHETYLQIKAKQEQHQEIISNLVVQEKASLEKLEQTKLVQQETIKTVASCKKDLQEIEHEYNQILESDHIKKVQQALLEIEVEAKKLIILSSDQQQKLEEELKLISNQILQETSPDYHIKQEAIVAELIKQETDIKIQIQAFEPQLQSYQTLDQQLIDIKKEEEQILTCLQKNQQEHQLLLMQKGSLEHKIKKQKELSVELNSIASTSKTLQQELVDYQEICKALGKDGIQALLIEQAIPEIEHETNLILSRLTNNQTQIFIESLKDLKKGGSKETLDIKIADSFGIRDYEMFSGGEAFRIDFALRIGISKLLARRAGTTLQTIFIDEGFGSQDEEGLGLIMDNIYKIQEDFAKIIVVSHLQEMKEQFPVQFIVEKKRSGSMVSIMLQG